MSASPIRVPEPIPSGSRTFGPRHLGTRQAHLSKPLTRRDALWSATALTLAGTLTGLTQGDEESSPMPGTADIQTPLRRPLAIATWKFGQLATDGALRELAAGSSLLDALEHGIRIVEASGGTSVGLTGKPNAAGFVQQDACLMFGPGQRAGSVAAIEGVRHPISAARVVMEQTKHVMVVGAAARELAIKAGLENVPIEAHTKLAEQWWRDVSLPQQIRDFEQPPEGLARPAVNEDDHDTVTLLLLGADGTICGGCSTSGLGNKFPGRVGDSPILGSGLYVDNEVGAAGGTGIGENIMRYGGSLRIVEAMRRGATPEEACQEVVRFIRQREGNDEPLEIFFVALDRFGRFGAAGTGEFPHAVAYAGFSEVLTAPPVPSS